MRDRPADRLDSAAGTTFVARMSSDHFEPSAISSTLDQRGRGIDETGEQPTISMIRMK